MRKAVCFSLLLSIILVSITSAAAQTVQPGNTAIASITLNQPLPVQEAVRLAKKYELTALMLEGDFTIGSRKLHDFYIIPSRIDIKAIESDYLKQRMAFFADISMSLDKALNSSEKHSAELQNMMENQAKAINSSAFQEKNQLITISKLILRGDSSNINRFGVDRPGTVIAIADENSLSKTDPQKKQESNDIVQPANSGSISDDSRWNPEVGVSYVYPSQNGGRYTYQWMWWNEIPFSSDQTYEHDYFLYNYDNDGTYLNGDDTGYPGCFPVIEYAATTWPAESKPYLDTRFAANYVSCERDEVAYTIGAAQADKLTANTWHYTYIHTTDGNVDNDFTTIQKIRATQPACGTCEQA